MINKLIIFDKDGTLTRPRSGAKFPQHPEDQELYPGVKDAIDRLRVEGWSMAIASNQGGCDVFEVKASQVRDGNILVHDDGDRCEIVEVIALSDGSFIFAHDRRRSHRTGNSYYYAREFFRAKPRTAVKIQYKTINSAIEEVIFAADLCEIDLALFCPKMDGSEAVKMQRTDDDWDAAFLESRPELGPSDFRKPGAGMLHVVAADLDLRCDKGGIMIGDRPEDEQAARSAGFRFIPADEWRSGSAPRLCDE